MIDKIRPFIFPVLALLVTALAFVPNPAIFAATFAGWWTGGLLLIATLCAAAAFADARSALVALAFILPVAMGRYGLPNAVGLPFLFAALILARRAPLPDSLWPARAVALTLMGWMGYAFLHWFSHDLSDIQSTWGYVKFFSPDWPEQWGRPSIAFPFGNANPMSGFAVMLIPLFVALTITEAKNKPWRTPWAIGSAMAIALLFLGSSRAGQLAPFCGVIAFLLLLPKSRLGTKPKLIGAGVTLVAAAGVVALHPRFRGWLTGKVDNDYSDEIRKDFLDGCLNLFREHPWTGVGPGGIPVHYSAHMGPYSDQPGCHQAHSTPLQWLAEYGVWGGALWFGLAGLTLLALWRAGRSDRNHALRSGAAIASVSYLAFSLLDYQLYLPVTAFAWGACIGFALRDTEPADDRKDIRTISRLSLLAAPSLMICSLVAESTARIECASAKRAFAAGRTAEGLDALGRAMASQPESPVYPAIAAGLVSTLQSDDNASAERNRAMADVLFAQARRNAPDFPYLAALHGRLWADADPAKADGILRDALRDAPKLPHAWLALARAHGRAGDKRSAVSALALRIMITPEEAFSPDIRVGFFNGAAKAVVTRFHELRALYEKEFPEDKRGIARLTQVARQIDAWEKAGENVRTFIGQNPGWSDSPAWRYLAATLDTRENPDGSLPLKSRCLMTSAAMLAARFEIKDGDASKLVNQCAGRAPLFDCVRILGSSDAFSAYGLYFGDATFSGPVTLDQGQTDLLAMLFVYESNPVRPHLAAQFFRDRLAEIPALSAKK